MRKGSSARLSVGVLDAGIASLATLLVGAYAIFFFADDRIGLQTYSLAFNGFILAGVIPAFLVYNPIEIKLLTQRWTEQLGALPRTVLLGAIPSFGASVLAALSLLVFANDAPSSTLGALAVTMTVASTLSPIQDHVRRVMHGAGKSQWAFATSCVQLGVVVAALALFTVTDFNRAWAPFGALATANAVSLTVATLLTRRVAEPPQHVELGASQVARAGGWVLAANLSERLGLYLALVIVANIAGNEPGANYEPARQLANALYVLGNGLIPVLREPVVQAAVARNAAAARKPIVTYVGMIGAAAVGWGLVAGIEWPFNPLPKMRMFSLAYEQNGMVLLMILWTAMWTISLMFANELMGGRRELSLAKTNMTATALSIATAIVLARPLGALAIPTALCVQFFTVNLLYALERRDLYRSGPIAVREPTEATV